VPFHTAQLALNGMDEEQVKEAAWAVQSVAGASAYVYSVGYDKSKFKQELDRAVAHIKQGAAKK
jgi:hypothetical protein